MSGYERTGWRDSELSERHRLWGFDCPAVDIDFLMVEYDQGEPVAVIDYKWVPDVFAVQEPSVGRTNNHALMRLGELAGLPALIVFYSRDPWLFRVSVLGTAGLLDFDWERILPEATYVRGLYRIRNRTLPPYIQGQWDRMVSA